MKLKLLALASIMTATMGLTACDSNKENAAEDLSDAQEEVQDAQEELNDADLGVNTADAEGNVSDAEAAVAEARASIDTNDDMDTVRPMDDTNNAGVVDPSAVDAADEVIVVEEEPAY